MKFELLDDLVIAIRSKFEISEDTVIEIEPEEDDDEEETEVEEESTEVTYVIENFMSSFALNIQTSDEIGTVILEADWDADLMTEEAEGLEYKVSEMMRVIRISYDDKAERKKIYQWLANQSEDFPFLTGFLEKDYILLPAKNILGYMTSLRGLSPETNIEE